MVCMRTWSSLSCLICAALVAACSAEPSSGDAADGDEADATKQRAAQMNDMSILFPLAKSQAELDSGYVLASASGARGTLLPLTLIKDNGFVWPDTHQPILAGGQLNQLRYPNVRVVAMRLDPCASHIGAITDLSTCQAQMRLVLEDLTIDAQSGAASATDAALHAGYNLTQAEFAAAIKEVVALRMAQAPKRDLGPLAPHPVMAEQGLGGAMADGVRKIILEYAGEKNLARVTRLSINGYDSPFHPRDWAFVGFNMVNGKRQMVNISALPPNSQREMLTPTSHLPNVAQTFPAFDPGPNVDDISTLRDLDTAKAASADQQKAALVSTLRIDSPSVHSFDTIDCASCHASQTFRSVIGEKGLGLESSTDENRFDPTKLVGDDGKSTFTPTDSQNFHALSYKGDVATISQRVVNETANVLAFTNAKILGVRHR